MSLFHLTDRVAHRASFPPTCKKPLKALSAAIALAFSLGLVIPSMANANTADEPLGSVAGGAHNSTLFTLANGDVYRVYDSYAHYYDVHSVADTWSAANDGLVEQSALLANLDTNGIFYFHDSTGDAFTVTSGTQETLIVTRSSGAVILIEDRYLDYYDRFTLAGIVGGDDDGMIDVATLAANANELDVYKLEDSSGTGFSVEAGNDDTLLIKRTNGQVITLDDDRMRYHDLYTTSASSGGADDGVIDIAAVAANADVHQNYIFEDSTGAGFSIKAGDDHRLLVRRDNGTIMSIHDSYFNYYDVYTTTSSSGGNNDGVIDVATLAPNADRHNVYIFEDSTGQGFSIIAGDDNSLLVYRDGGEIIRIGTSYLDNYDSYSTAGTSGNDRDGKIDIAAISSNADSLNIHKFNDTTGDSFTVSRASDAALLVIRENGEVIRIHDSYLNHYDHYTTTDRSGGTNDGIVDVAALSANTNQGTIYKYSDGYGNAGLAGATDPGAIDSDGDGLSDASETSTYSTDPNNHDTDGDSVSDGAEVLTYSTDPTITDTDSDGLADGDEINTHLTDPLNADTDADNLNDGDELNLHSTDPNLTDTDGDGQPDGTSVPASTDSDGDGLTNAQETDTYGTDPNKADTDGDGLSDSAEINTHLTDPLNADTDGDGLSDGVELSTYNTDPTLADTDGDGRLDGANDPATTDTDGDGLSDAEETDTYGTDPNNADTDGDSLSDGDEVSAYNTDPTKTDTDGDGLNDGAEVNIHSTNPVLADTDADGLTDGAEVNTHSTDPVNADTDSDGLSDSAEINIYNTDPNLVDSDGDGQPDGATATGQPDSDGDGLTDAEETGTYNTNPNNPDSDDDGLSDSDELQVHNTNPNNVDTDGDGLNDGAEVNTYSTNPTLADSDADGLDDGAEINTHSTDPLLADSDGDGLEDSAELNTHNTNPGLADSDGDGLDDNAELFTHLSDPMNADSDGDGLDDGDELNTYLTDPVNADSDGDGLSDGEEVDNNTDPNLVDTDGDGQPDGLLNPTTDNTATDNGLITGVRGSGCVLSTEPRPTDPLLLTLLTASLLGMRRRKQR